jgi:hypothetical protein
MLVFSNELFKFSSKLLDIYAVVRNLCYMQWRLSKLGAGLKLLTELRSENNTNKKTLKQAWRRIKAPDRAPL